VEATLPLPRDEQCSNDAVGHVQIVRNGPFVTVHAVVTTPGTGGCTVVDFNGIKNELRNDEQIAVRYIWLYKVT
jgi:hypothetical protein